MFLVVETVEPFNVSVNFVDNREAALGKSEWKGVLKAFKYCLDNEQFDMGYDFRLFGNKDYHTLEMPKYVKNRFAEYDV